MEGALTACWRLLGDERPLSQGCGRKSAVGNHVRWTAASTLVANLSK